MCFATGCENREVPLSMFRQGTETTLTPSLLSAPGIEDTFFHGTEGAKKNSFGGKGPYPRKGGEGAVGSSSL